MTPTTAKLRLLNLVWEKILLKHFNRRTEQAYVDWVRRCERAGTQLGALARGRTARRPAASYLRRSNSIG